MSARKIASPERVRPQARRAGPMPADPMLAERCIDVAKAILPASGSETDDLAFIKGYRASFSDPRQGELAEFWMRQLHDILDIPFRDVYHFSESMKVLLEKIPRRKSAESDREAFKRFIGIFHAISVAGGRSDIAVTLELGWYAIDERDHGFDEELFRPIKTTDHREPAHIRRMKAIAAYAYLMLRAWGIPDAAKRVAKIADGAGLCSRSDKSLTARSVVNWAGRLTGRMQDGGVPLSLRIPADTTLFIESRALWRQGKVEAARDTMLSELRAALDEMMGGN
jgi:hypothetical protein